MKTNPKRGDKVTVEYTGTVTGSDLEWISVLIDDWRPIANQHFSRHAQVPIAYATVVDPPIQVGSVISWLTHSEPPLGTVVNRFVHSDDVVPRVAVRTEKGWMVLDRKDSPFIWSEMQNEWTIVHLPETENK